VYYADFLLGLLFHPDDIGVMFLRYAAIAGLHKVLLNRTVEVYTNAIIV
jgi:hypothetical protein